MSVFSRCLLSASQQFLRNASPTLLDPRAKMIAGAALLAVSAASVLVSPAHAQNSNANQSPLPANSAGRWGELLGSVMGRAAGVALSGNAATSEVGRGLQRVSIGVSEEMGRNLGRSAAQKPYASGGEYQAARSPAGMAAALASIPDIERDYIDTLGVNAVLAYGPAAAAQPAAPSYRAAQDARVSALRDFELALRATADRGFSVSPWADVRSSLQQPLRAVPEARLLQYAQEMTRRLNRPGGPGYAVPYSYQHAQQQVVQQAHPAQQSYPQPQSYPVQQARPNSLEAMRVSMNGMLKPVTSADRP